MRRALVIVIALAALFPGTAVALTPNDPGWSHQWAERLMRLPAVWDHTTGTPDVVIASVDTGVETTLTEHLVDLQGALVPGWDFIDGDAVTDDEHGHGTMTAGLMVGRGNNHMGIAGMCWRCRLMPVRVSENGLSSDEQVAAGIRWAIDQGARIVTIGLVREHGGAVDPVLRSAIDYGVSRGVLLVTPAGNNGDEALTYPGAYPGVIATAATDQNDKLYDWSTRGPWVPLAAPGEHALIASNGSWGVQVGTSFTAPQIAGIAALALSLRPTLTAAQIADSLRATVVPVAGIGGGRVDAYAALRHLGAIPAPPPPKPPKPRRVTHVRTGTIRHVVRLAVSAGTGNLALNLTVKPADRCALIVSTGSELVIARRRPGGALALSAQVEAGRHRAEITCRSSRPKRYRLTVSAVAPTQAAARISGR